jgi:hypothetical protein
MGYTYIRRPSPPALNINHNQSDSTCSNNGNKTLSTQVLSKTYPTKEKTLLICWLDGNQGKAYQISKTHLQRAY